MTRESVLMILGALIVVSPFAGLPLSWLSWILPVLGLLVLGIAFWQRRDRLAREQSDL